MKKIAIFTLFLFLVCGGFLCYKYFCENFFDTGEQNCSSQVGIESPEQLAQENFVKAGVSQGVQESFVQDNLAKNNFDAENKIVNLCDHDISAGASKVDCASEIKGVKEPACEANNLACVTKNIETYVGGSAEKVGEAGKAGEKIGKSGETGKNKTLENKTLKPSILFLDPKYNHALVQDHENKNWVVSGVFTGNLEFNAFNDRGCNICLSKFLFGDFKIMDIFLLSKLSYDNKLYIEDLDLPVNISQLLRNTKQDQYLAYIAPFNVEINAENYEQRFDFGAIYRFGIGKNESSEKENNKKENGEKKNSARESGKRERGARENGVKENSAREKIVCSLGFNIPIERRLHIMSLDLVGLDMTKCGFTQAQINFVLDDFHSNYIDFMDFFNRVVLQPKGLNFIERQQKLGLGDMSCFAYFDFNRLTKYIDGLQLGIDLTAPTAGCKGKFKGCDVWEVILGNGGAWQFGISSNILFKTSRNWFNPSAFLAGKFNSEYCGYKRVAMFKENNSDVPVLAKNVPNLIAPVYQDHYVRKFAQYDSCVHDFADQAIKVKTKLGSTLLFSLGNYFYNVFRENFRLALFYDVMYKLRDSVCVCDQNVCANIWQNGQQFCKYDTCALEKFTNMSAQQFSWHLAYTSKNGIEVNVGSKHVFAGKNCPQTNSVVAALIANF